MADKTRMIEKVIAEVMESHLPQMQKELAHRLVQEAMPHAGKSAKPEANGNAGDLLKAISAIHAGTTQKEILRALLDATTSFCGRAALFVVKSGLAHGWQGRAFENSNEIKDFELDVNSPAVSQVLETRTILACKTAEMDARFVAQFNSPADDRVLLLPLLLKDKIAALVYADGGADNTLDQAAMQLLVLSTGTWLEVASGRKHAPKESVAEPETETHAAPEPKAQSYSDPFAAHAPKHVMAAAAGAESSSATEVVAASTGAAAAPAADPFANMSVEDADVHRKAQRFARLLIDEVKLYNQAKVAEGRKKKDLYDRLKEDIDKSRGTYMKRYGNTVAASANYVDAEIVRSLAGDDASLLGPNFHR
jgi:hypothetical protein